VKRSLPTFGDKRAADAARTPRSLLPAPQERRVPTRALVCVAPVRLDVTTWTSASTFAAEIARELVKLEPNLALLVTADRADIAGLAQASFGKLAEVGAKRVQLLSVSPADAATVVEHALTELADVRIVLALGQAAALYFQPLLSVVIAGPTPTASGRHPALALQADLEVSDPSAALARELSHLVIARLR
jgi:hypothetical protein